MRWRALVEYLKDIFPEQGVIKVSGKTRLKVFIATCGWSGCEEIIEALEKADNGMFWLCCWQKSIRGGKYWFKLPKGY